MDVRWVHMREWLVGLAGLALLVSLFLPWLGAETEQVVNGEFTAYGPTIDVSAWEWLSILDIYLALVATGALGVTFFTAQQQTQAVPLALLSLTTMLAIIAFVWLVIRLLTAPDGTSLEYGAWLGLATSAGVVGAGLWSMRDEHIGAPSHGEPPEVLPAP